MATYGSRGVILRIAIADDAPSGAEGALVEAIAASGALDGQTFTFSRNVRAHDQAMEDSRTLETLRRALRPLVED